MQLVENMDIDSLAELIHKIIEKQFGMAINQIKAYQK